MPARSCSAAPARRSTSTPTGECSVETIEVPLEEWSVCLPEHHPGYVTWEEYLATRERLRANVRPRGEGGGAAREGGALLQGLLRCGRCGRRMQVAYSGNDGRRVAVCVRARAPSHGTEQHLPVARRRAAGQGGRRRVPGSGHPGRRRRERRRDRRARASSTRRGSPASDSRSSAPSSKPSARSASSTRASPRTGSSRARSNASSRTRSPSVEREQRTLAALEHARPAPLTDRRAPRAHAPRARSAASCGPPTRPATATARSCCAR